MKAALAVACLLAVGCSKPQPQPQPVQAPTLQRVTEPAAPPPKAAPDPLIVKFREKFDAFEEEARSAYNLAVRLPNQKDFAAKRAAVDDAMARIPEAPHRSKELAQVRGGCELVALFLPLVEKLVRTVNESFEVGLNEQANKGIARIKEASAKQKLKLAEMVERLDQLTGERPDAPLWDKGGWKKLDE
jgi:hypothetical protein